tara:strand:+ start:669765 stop:670817 length:1053 start_codon:yes stop_codon:yes gene_type:complete
MRNEKQMELDRREAITLAAAATAGLVIPTTNSFAEEAALKTPEFCYDVIIVGGGPSGLSAALVLGRCCRKVLLCDAGKPRNRTSPAVHGFFSRDGIRPDELLEIGREQLQPYDVEIQDVAIAKAERLDTGFRVETGAGKQFTTRKLILATGVKDDLPEIAGLADLWGIGVYHCPYCHGWEVRDQRWAYIASANQAVDWGSELKGWTTSLTYCSNGSTELTDEIRGLLKERGIELQEQPIKRVESMNERLTGIVFTDGESLNVEAMFIRAPMIQRSELLKQLGCQLTSIKGMFTDAVKTDQFGAADVPGLYVIGDASLGAPQVATAVSDGSMAAIMVNKSLVKEGVAQSSK